MNRKEFGQYFSKLRKKSGFKSQRQLAYVSGVSNGTIARIETGAQAAKPETLKKLAPHLSYVTYTELLSRAGYLQSEATNADKVKENSPRMDITYEDFIILEEIKKFPPLYADLMDEPAKKVRKLSRIWELIKDEEDKYE